MGTGLCATVQISRAHSQAFNGFYRTVRSWGLWRMKGRPANRRRMAEETC